VHRWMRPRSDPVQRRHPADVQQRGGLDERGHLPAAEPRLPERFLHVPGNPLRQHVHDAEHRRSLRRVRQRVQRSQRRDGRLQRNRLHLYVRHRLRRLQHGEREHRRLRLPHRIDLEPRDGRCVLRLELPNAAQQRRRWGLLRLQPAWDIQRRAGDRSGELGHRAGRDDRHLRLRIVAEPGGPPVQDDRWERVMHVLGLLGRGDRGGRARHRQRGQLRMLLPLFRSADLELTAAEPRRRALSGSRRTPGRRPAARHA
jgi:hypothetical protein